jgi:hypothetical protein
VPENALGGTYRDRQVQQLLAIPLDKLLMKEYFTGAQIKGPPMTEPPTASNRALT